MNLKFIIFLMGESEFQEFIVIKLLETIIQWSWIFQDKVLKINLTNVKENLQLKRL